MSTEKTPKLLFGNIPYKITERDVSNEIKKYFPTVKVTIPQKGGRSQGLALVEFESMELANKAKDKFDNTDFFGRTTYVSFADDDPKSSSSKYRESYHSRHRYHEPRRHHSYHESYYDHRHDYPRHRHHHHDEYSDDYYSSRRRYHSYDYDDKYHSPRDVRKKESSNDIKDIRKFSPQDSDSSSAKD